MTDKPVVPRDKARQDIDDAIEYYLKEAGDDVALRFIGALERAFALVSAQPLSGSLRYAYELNLPGLRVWQLREFPWLVFYLEAAEHIDVWRVLHGKRDIPGWMAEPLDDD
ncbi:MAG: type II toxin-antitoxin system RelE/ParE family toxin [Roseovarius sp.]|nr:type II toxin-antitoxin system RelE/ParE family toxin [Roseovarius sp.]